MASSEAIEKLAAEIGESIYIDVAKWHLYLRDAHLHTPLAEQFYPLLESDTLTATAVEQVLGTIPVSLGGGLCTVPLANLIPKTVKNQLVMLLEDFQRQL